MSNAKFTATVAVAAALVSACAGATIPGTPGAAPTTPRPSTVTLTQPPTTLTPPPVTITTTQEATPPPPPPPVTAPTTPYYFFEYPFQQGTSDAELAITQVVLDPANNNDWGANNDQPRTVVYAVCQLNTDTSVPEQFNCNIAFDDGVALPFWVDPTDAGSYTAKQRTHQ